MLDLQNEKLLTDAKRGVSWLMRITKRVEQNDPENYLPILMMLTGLIVQVGAEAKPNDKIIKQAVDVYRNLRRDQQFYKD